MDSILSGGIKVPSEVFGEPGVEEYLKEELKTVVSSINALRKFCLVSPLTGYNHIQYNTPMS